jgi:BCD family chlorophyll transporter-like MFS transporter
MNSAPRDQVGLALGAWGAVQATAAGAGVALGGIGRDAVHALASRGVFGEALATPATGYAFIYCIEIVLLLATLGAMMALLRSDAQRSPAHGITNQHQWSVS